VMIMPRTSSVVPSVLLTVPTSFPWSITLIRSARSKTSWISCPGRSPGLSASPQTRYLRTLSHRHALFRSAMVRALRTGGSACAGREERSVRVYFAPSRSSTGTNLTLEPSPYQPEQDRRYHVLGRRFAQLPHSIDRTRTDECRVLIHAIVIWHSTTDNRHFAQLTMMPRAWSPLHAKNAARTEPLPLASLANACGHGHDAGN
jgi:hypothetical protein